MSPSAGQDQRLRRYWDKHARSYDKQMGFLDRHLFGDSRQWICSQPAGDVLEVAIGSGLNLGHYPDDVRLTGIEWSPVPLRQRRRAAATREILDAAQEQIALHGPSGLALRSVARSLGMTVQALYHYFSSRDELVTAPITGAYHDLADAVQTALDTAPPDADLPTFITAAEGFRRWAIENSPRFQLIYGTPLLHYEAPADGRTTAGARRIAAVFLHELFGDFTDEQLARAEVPPLSRALRARFEQLPPEAIGALPPQAAALFISTWGHMHGLVVLEVFGHTAFIGPLQAEVFRGAMYNLLSDAHRRIPAR